MINPRRTLCISLLAGTMAGPVSAQSGERPDPTIRSGATVAISDHVYVILDNGVSMVPNVGIVVGDRGTLVIDTGLGEANGRIVLAEATGVARSDRLYVAATHAHPEHDLGASAFPAEATLIRSRDQQADVDEFGMGLANRFATFSARHSQLLEGAEIRVADVVFDNELVIDLGGVTVRVHEVGPTHTRGDMTFHVEEDDILFSGDVIMPAFPAFNSPYSSVTRWILALDELQALQPSIIVPSHGHTGSMELLEDYKSYLVRLGSRVDELAAQGLSSTEAGTILTPELTRAFGQWPAPGNRVEGAVAAAYRDRSRSR